MSLGRLDVCAIGNAIVDVLARCDDDFLASESIAKGAMTLIDEARAEALFAHMGDSTVVSGGSAANTAVGVASLGGNAAFIGRVRDDQLGKLFRHDMTANRVDFTTDPATAGPTTARSYILVTPDAQRSMNTYLGAASEFSPEDLQTDVLRDASITYLEGYLFDKSPAQAAFRMAATVVQQAGRKLSLSLSDTFCVERHRASFRSLVEDSVDVLFSNQNELMALYQTRDIDTAIAYAAQSCGITVTTMSEKGAVLTMNGEKIHVPAEAGTKVIDTTGAGDQFAAGVLYGLARNLPLATCGRLGAIAAAEVISHIGPRPQVKLHDLVHKKAVKLK